MVKRRTFLDSLLGLGFVSTAVAVLYPVWRFLVPPASGEPATASVVAGKASAFKPNSGAVFKFGSEAGHPDAHHQRRFQGLQRGLHASRLHGAVQAGHVADLVRVPQRPLRSRRQCRGRAAAAPARNVSWSTCAASRARKRSSCRADLDRTAMTRHVLDVAGRAAGSQRVCGSSWRRRACRSTARTFWYYLGGITLFLFGRAGIHRHAAAALLPARARRSLRERPVHRHARSSSAG